MESRLHLITLGVKNLERAGSFYEALGWQRSSASTPEIIFFKGVPALALFGRDDLAQDAGVSPVGQGFAGVAFGWNQPSTEAVDHFMDLALAQGAQEIKPAQATLWGGYAGYFADLDGHLWELVYNPFFPFDLQGHLDLP